MAKSKFSRKSIIAGGIGNVLEWYDFAVYAYFATVLANNFFPKEDEVAGLIATFGIFAIGYLVRPLGGLIFGRIGDKYGRKKALTNSVLLMAIPTTLIGLIPTYSSLGLWAAAILMFLRLLQGISVGGELTGSISFIVEKSPKEKRGLFGSASVIGAIGGILLGSLVGAILTNVLDTESLNSWGWRLPFLSGIIIGIAGLLIRRNMDDTETFENLKLSGNISESPIKEFFRDYKLKAVKTILSLWCYSVSFYLLFLYLASYENTFLDYDLEDALSINTIAMIFLLCCIPIMAHLSDKVGRKKVLITGQISFLIVSIPLFFLLDDKQHWHILVAQLVFAIVVATQQGPMPATLVEQYPARIRLTGISVSYNIALALFGGTTPIVSTWLIHSFDNNIFMPCYYLMFSAAVSLIAVSLLEETYKKELE